VLNISQFLLELSSNTGGNIQPYSMAPYVSVFSFLFKIDFFIIYFNLLSSNSFSQNSAFYMPFLPIVHVVIICNTSRHRVTVHC